MYDSNAQAVSNQLVTTSSSVFTQETIDSILSLVTSTTDTKIVVDTVTAANNATITPAIGTELVFVTVSGATATNVIINGATPVVMFQGNGGVNATIGGAIPTATSNVSAATADPHAIARVVVGTAGADTITIADGKNTQIVAGDKDVIKAGTGHTVVTAAQGSSTVVGGVDTIVDVAGKEADFKVSAANGHAKIVNATTGVSVDMTGVNYVQLDNKDALIFAGNTKQAVVANLFHAVLGRNADAGGLDYWFDQVSHGVSTKAVAQSLMASSEYAGASQTNAQFVTTLYSELMGRTADTAGNAFWLEKRAAGVSRVDVAVAFAEAASTNAGEVTVVGTVTIIDGYGV